jgi:hypothetical protein
MGRSIKKAQKRMTGQLEEPSQVKKGHYVPNIHPEREGDFFQAEGSA